MMFNQKDFQYMKRALSLAKKGQGKTGVNPVVGAVIVKHGRIIGEGWHVKRGLDHAEVKAMKRLDAGMTEGAEMYVNLEPCCHLCKKTPPCTEKIISGGISRVVIAMKDPNRCVNGKGIRRLKQAGIKVETGIMKEDAMSLNAFYIKSIGTSLPYVTLKHAISIDGKIAAKDGTSKWISGYESRKDVHKMRKVHDAVMTTGVTVMKDNPSLTVRLVKGRNPLKIIVDWELMTDPDSKVYGDGNVMVITGMKTEKKRVDEFSKREIDVLCFNRMEGYKPILKALYKKGVGSILVEAGGRFATRLIDEGLIDRAIYYMAPKYLGGEGYGSIGDMGVNTIGEAKNCTITGFDRIGSDLKIEVAFR